MPRIILASFTIYHRSTLTRRIFASHRRHLPIDCLSRPDGICSMSLAVYPVVYAMPFAGYNFPFFYLRRRSVEKNTSHSRMASSRYASNGWALFFLAHFLFLQSHLVEQVSKAHFLSTAYLTFSLTHSTRPHIVVHCAYTSSHLPSGYIDIRRCSAFSRPQGTAKK
jgi:hypothetical protein